MKKRNSTMITEKKVIDIMTKTFDAVRDLDPEIAYGVWDSEIKAFMDASTLKSLFYSESWVYITCNIIANAASSVNMCVYKYKQDGTKEKSPNHTVQKIIEYPNQRQSEASFFYNVAVEEVLGGNALVWFQQTTRQLIILPFDQVQLKFDKLGNPEFWIWSANNESKTGMKIPFKEVIHIQRPNPNSTLWGLSPFTPTRKSILFNRYSQDFLNQFYLKGATPQTVLRLTENASPEAAKRLLRTFESQHTGRRNHRRTLMLPKGVELDTMNISIADQQLKDLVNMNREDILAALQVPKHVVSLAEAGSLGSEEHKMAIKFFWQNCVIPMLKRIAGQFNLHFKQMLGNEYYIEYDLEKIEALRDDEMKKAQLAKELLAFMTINEVRKRIFELEPINNGDNILSLINLQQNENQLINEIPNQIELENDQTQLETQTEENQLKKKFKKQLEIQIKAQDEIVKTDGKKITMLAIETLGKQYGEAIKVLKKNIKKDAKLDKLAKEIAEAITKPIIKNSWKKTYTETLESSVELGYQIQLESLFNAEARQAVDAIGRRGIKQRRRILEERGIETFSNISKTTTENIMRVIESGMQENKPITQIAQDLVEQSRQLTIGRANTIARTETLTAVSIGQWAETQDAKKVIPNIKKIWLTANDEKVRESHNQAENDGAIDIDKEFSNGLKFPRDPSGDPEEVINCRCVLITAAPEDL